jgi:hypothetical protein
MKVWWMATLGLVVAAAAAQAGPVEKEVKGEDGQTLAVVVLCNNCKSGTGESKKACHGGVERGWLNGKPCGQCMIDGNHDAVLRYPHDLHFSGTLTDTAGQPVKERFVKMFMAGGWSVRTRTSDKGAFRLMLGATAERKSKQPLVVDLGTLTDSKQGDAQYYAIFLLPSPYKPCSEAAAAPAKKTNGKKR